MDIIPLENNKELCEILINYANNCNREAGPILAQKIKNNDFSVWERVFIVVENDKIVGFCTFTRKDGIPDCDYSPFVGFIFVDKNYRGKRVSEKMINSVEKYAKTLNFKKLYIVSDHKGLYEKYGFQKVDNKIDELGRVETIFCRDIK